MTASALPPPVPADRCPGAWPLTCLWIAAASGVLGLAATLGGWLPQSLIWHVGHWPQAPWTLWTAALVHFLPAHGLANALALAALAALGAALGASRRDALALLLAWPLGTLALLRWPQVGGYYGLSLLIHAASAVLAVRALASARTRWLGLLLAGGLCIKLALERGWRVPVGFDSGWGFNVVFAAHLSGAVAGAALALTLALVGLCLPVRR
ncbi:MAG: hypothetical protein Q4F13_12190 [Pseudomonadota bacterium]|nr:hypothetical protein [Pseudomonadota bacterium]